MIVPPAIALGGAVAVAAVAWRGGALTATGAVAATAVGTAAALAGMGWAALLIGFFVVSTLLSRLGAARKADRTASVIEKHGGRDARQVLANGGVFAVGAVCFAVTADALWTALALGALVGAFADTAATEIGTLFGGTPRSIVDGRPVATGMSGGVTATGSIAAVAAAGLLALCATALITDLRVASAAFVGGLIGVAADSVLGAVVQVRRWCPACAQPTERRRHACGTLTRVAGGLPWLDNDAVNAASTLTSALVAAALVLWLPR